MNFSPRVCIHVNKERVSIGFSIRTVERMLQVSKFCRLLNDAKIPAQKHEHVPLINQDKPSVNFRFYRKVNIIFIQETIFVPSFFHELSPPITDSLLSCPLLVLFRQSLPVWNNLQINEGHKLPNSYFLPVIYICPVRLLQELGNNTQQRLTKLTMPGTNFFQKNV